MVHMDIVDAANADLQKVIIKISLYCQSESHREYNLSAILQISVPIKGQHHYILHGNTQL